jgi:ribose transport system permease protein
MNDTIATQSPSRRRFRLPGLERASVVYLFAVIIVLFSLWTPETFLTRATFKLVLADQVIVGILALAVIIPLSAGAFDLSCGANLAFSLVIISWLQRNTGLNGFMSCAIGVLASGAIGFVNGLVSVYFRVNSFIATLGSSQVLAAAALYISGNKQMVGVFSKRFLSFGRGQVFGIPVVVFYLLGLALLVWYVLEWTPLGRKLRATGANVEAARLAGVRTDRVMWGSLVASGLISGLAGAVFAAKVGTFSNGFGTPLLFPAFAAVFFGATQFQRRANAWGTIIAVYALAFGEKGLQLTFQSGVTWIEPLFNGLALLIAVILASRQGGFGIRRRPVATHTIGPAQAAQEPHLQQQHTREKS